MRCLVVIDMQKDFIDGALGTEEAKQIIPNVKKLIFNCLNDSGEVIFTQDLHEEDYLNTHEGKMLPIPHCIYGTPGFEIEKSLLPCRYSVIRKGSFGAFDWERYIDTQYCDRIEIAGLCTDICVISNALILRSMFPEIDIAVYQDCCAGTTPQNHDKALDVMRACQIEVLSLDDLDGISCD